MCVWGGGGERECVCMTGERACVYGGGGGGGEE